MQFFHKRASARAAEVALQPTLPYLAGMHRTCMWMAFVCVAAIGCKDNQSASQGSAPPPVESASKPARARPEAGR